jgi:hypothetical protein
MTVVEKLISMPSLETALKIAQRFNAGSRLREPPKSRQGRQDRVCLLAFLSSLKGLRNFDHMIIPALKRWAIFRSTNADCCSADENIDNLRLAS